ncbi:Signal transduction histidine kinase CheA [hydrothermal vent metagenome]|uniref:Chemotaxis protein CheA n=1 Tax=hydrothermal vent metagenome TaxID=652676 RepID=A0A3B1BWM7_9ZZZZ
MADEIDKEILFEFIKETVEELDALDAQFVALENHPKDSAVINSIFRTVHSIKGSSSFFNLNHIRTFAHKFENLLDELRKGKKNVTVDTIDLLLRGKDCLHDMFGRLAEGDMGTDLSEGENATLDLINKKLEGDDEAGEKSSPEQIFIKLTEVGGALRSEGATDNPNIAEALDLIDSLRVAVLGPDKSRKMGEILVEKGVVSQQDVVEALSEQKKLGEILVDKGKASSEEIASAAKEQKERAAPPPTVGETKPVLKKTMRIEEEKIDEFMNLVGELIINSEVFNYIQKKLETGQDLDKIVLEFKSANLDFNELTLKLQTGLGEVRKVAIKSIFQKLPRIVRDLSAQTGKQVEVDIRGEDLLIDKSLLERLESPLIHMIRNSVDHGVELKEDRIKAGKTPGGKVSILADEVLGDLVIQIIDDGKGLDPEKMKAKGIDKGLITEEEARTMPDEEAFKLIFAPGFSTAAKVTDVSGRGVGMDVVMTMVKDVKGKVDIDTGPGKGMRLSISVPMSSTLITISGLLVEVGAEQYIIPMEWVKESLRPKEKQIVTVAKKGEVVNIRKQLYPLIKLHDVFKIKTRQVNPWDGVVMVIEKDDLRCCLLVDEIIDETQAVLKDLGEPFQKVSGVMGGAILGDGKIGLVLDVEGLMRDRIKNREM